MTTYLYSARTDVGGGQINRWDSDNKVWAAAATAPMVVASIAAVDVDNIFLGMSGGNTSVMKLYHWDGQSTFTDMPLPGTTTQTTWYVTVLKTPNNPDVLWAIGSINGVYDMVWRCTNASQGASATWSAVAGPDYRLGDFGSAVVADEDTLYLGVFTGIGGVIRVTSGGSITQESGVFPGFSTVTALAIHPSTGELWALWNWASNYSIMYYGTFGGAWNSWEFNTSPGGAYPYSYWSDSNGSQMQFEPDGTLIIPLTRAAGSYLLSGDPTLSQPSMTEIASVDGAGGGLSINNGYGMHGAGPNGGYYRDAVTGLWVPTGLGNTRTAVDVLSLDVTLPVDVPLGANYIDGARYDDPSDCVGAINLIPQHGETDVKSTASINLHLVSYLNAEIE